MIIRNPINPYPQNITVEPSNTKIEFTFSGERLGSYYIRVYSYSPTSGEDVVYTTRNVQLDNYVYNGEKITHDEFLANMKVESNKSYTWEVVMCPNKDIGSPSATSTSSLRYFFETSSVPKIVPEPESNSKGLLINKTTVEYDSENKISVENLGSRIMEIEGYYKDGNIKYYYFQLFDEDQNLLEQTNKTFSSKILYKFTGLLSSKNYKLYLFTVSQKEQQMKLEITFNVSYSFAQNIFFSPELTCDENKGSVKLKWPQDMTANGKASGTYEIIDENRAKINTGTVVYDNISSKPLVMDENNFAFGIKTFLNDATTKIFDYINNDILYEAYIKDYNFYLKYGDIKATDKTELKAGQFKNNVVFGIQTYEEAIPDTGYLLAFIDEDNNEEYEFTVSEDYYIIIPEEEQNYQILLQKKDGEVSYETSKVNVGVVESQ